MVDNLEAWRRLAGALCEYACGYARGRDKTDPVYVEVTEGRDGPGPAQRKRYSSCGDLAHWMFERLGLREKFLNRASLGPNGANGWVPGVNVSRLAYCGIAKIPKPGWCPQLGDVLLVWNTPQGTDAHVTIALGPPVDGKLRTANYGAGGMSEAISPGARIASGPFVEVRAGVFQYSTKRVQRYLSLEDAVALSTAPPDCAGAILPGEVLDALGV